MPSHHHRRTVRLLIVAMLALAMTALAPGTAAAGGPTSVLLASPSTETATGLYHDDADYTALFDMVGGYGTPTASTGEPPTTAGGPYVNATWLVHDVVIWRIDRIFLVGDGVWVASQVSDEGDLSMQGMFPGETGNPRVVWHQPANPGALTALLARHGLVAGSAADGLDGGSLAAANGVAVTAEPDPTDTAASAPTAAAAADNQSWTWAIGGLLAGLLIAGGAGWGVLARQRTQDRARAAGAARPGADQPPVPMIPA